jgi:hypothetical protein
LIGPRITGKQQGDRRFQKIIGEIMPSIYPSLKEFLLYGHIDFGP